MQDYGYSNYTVEGTTFYCFLKKHPDQPFDRFYGDDKRLNHANNCKHYRHGIPIELDVDQVNIEPLTPIQKCMINLTLKDTDLNAGPYQTALTKMLILRRDK